MLHSAVLLAGGKSTRMGRDKAQLLVRGQPLWQRQLDVLRETGAEEVFISGPLDGPYAQSGLRIVPDVAENAGPLGGLAASLAAGSTDWLLILAVDMPHMEPRILRALLATAAQSGTGVVPVNATGRLEPLAAVYPKGALPNAEECLRAGKLQLSAFVEMLERAGLIQRTLIREPHCFANWNTPADLAGEDPGSGRA